MLQCNLHELMLLHALAVGFVRTKYDANVQLSDKELFESLPMKDPWLDADMVTVFCYMMDHPNTVIPDSWLGTMQSFRQELLKETTCDRELLELYNNLTADH